MLGTQQKKADLSARPFATLPPWYVRVMLVRANLYIRLRQRVTPAESVLGGHEYHRNPNMNAR